MRFKSVSQSASSTVCVPSGQLLSDDNMRDARYWLTAVFQLAKCQEVKSSFLDLSRRLEVIAKVLVGFLSINACYRQNSLNIFDIRVSSGMPQEIAQERFCIL